MDRLVDKDRQYVWHPFTQEKTAGDNTVIVRANEEFLVDENGRQIIDANSSWWTNIHGHNHPVVMDRIKDQLGKLDHCIFAGFTHPQAIELAEKLCLLSSYDKAFFSDDGSTSIEVALKMAIQYFYNEKVERKKSNCH